jgi:hypothetical protein
MILYRIQRIWSQRSLSIIFLQLSCKLHEFEQGAPVGPAGQGKQGLGFKSLNAVVIGPPGLY